MCFHVAFCVVFEECVGLTVLTAGARHVDDAISWGVWNLNRLLASMLLVPHCLTNPDAPTRPTTFGSTQHEMGWDPALFVAAGGPREDALKLNNNACAHPVSY